VGKKQEGFDIAKIKRFTEQELSNLAKLPSELPFCYQIGTDVLIGVHRIVKIDDKCWRVTQNNITVFEFFNRKDAIFYCIAIHKQQPKIANDIRDNDSLLNKLEFEAILYRHRYKSANDKRDDWGAEYYSNRYTETMHKIEYVKKELTKSLNLAKYIKV